MSNTGDRENGGATGDTDENVKTVTQDEEFNSYDLEKYKIECQMLI